MANKIFKLVDTEKTHKMADGAVYVFLVSTLLCKGEIKKIVERDFSVKVVDVRTLTKPKKSKYFRGHVGHLNQYKKAYVKLADGMKIGAVSDIKK